jgi:hypothetical protein
MSYNMMIGYDIYDCFTMEHFRLRQRMTLTIKIYCSRLYKSRISSMDQLFKSNLTFCVACVFPLQTDEWCVHNRSIDSSTPTLRRNLNEHPILEKFLTVNLDQPPTPKSCLRWAFYVILFYSIKYFFK